MKKTYFMIKILIIIIILQLVVLPTISQASIWDNIYDDATSFLEQGQAGANSLSSAEVGEASSSIFAVLVGIGVVLAVIIGGILGIQFMAASAEDKAKIKETLIPYIIGCVIIFGAIAIWQLVVNILQGIAT